MGTIGYETAAKLYENNKALVEARFPRFFLKEFRDLGEQKLIQEAKTSTKMLKESVDVADISGNLCIEKNTKKPYSRKNFYFNGKIYLREIKEGGIFAALWAACEDLNKIRMDADKDSADCPRGFLSYGNIGCEIHLEAIPIDQHVVEILELLKENPYEVSSAGSYLVILTDGEEADGKLLASGNADKVYAPDMNIDEAANHLVKIGMVTNSKDRVVIAGESRRFLTPLSRQAQDIADRKRNS